MRAGSLDRRSLGPLEATIHLPVPIRRAFVAFAALAIAVVAVPANADTSSQLDTAKREAAAAQSELDRVAAAWQAAEARLAVAQDAAASARARIAELESRLHAVQRRLNERAAALYMAGGDPTVMALITSGSVEEVADRLQFAGAVAQGDADLATQVSVKAQELQWERQRLAAAVADGQAAARALQSQSDAIRGRVADLQSRVSTLQKELASEQAAAAVTAPTTTGGGSGSSGSPPPITGSGWLLTCPVNGPTSFTDSFGDPRPGGRSHEGIDMIAAFGTPVVAVHSGTVHRTSSSTGGYGTVIFHDGSADWTFYTHFSSYAGPSSGHVSAGDTIGLVGSTGDTTVNHLHFEYHPGGGAAVDPYSALLGIC